MSFVLDNESFSELSKEVLGNYNVWVTGLKSLSDSMQNIIDSDDFQGAGASSLKQYLETIHASLIMSLNLLVNNHKGNFTDYKREYYECIETDKYGRIESSELEEDIKASIVKTNKKSKSIDSRLTESLNKVSDIYSVKRQDLTKVTYDHDKLTKDIEELIKNINECEQKHFNSDFVNTRALIQSITKVIEECKEKDRKFIADFSLDSLSEISSISLLGINTQNAYQEASEKAESYKLSTESAQKHIEAIKEDREKKAEVIKWVVLGVTVIASVAVIAASGGTATPLVMGLLGAGTGITNKMAEDLTDEYVEHGGLTKYNNWKRIDYDKLGKDVVVSGVSGFATGYVGGYAGKAVGKIGPLKTLANSSKFGDRIVSSAISKGLTNVAKGETERIVSSTVEETWDWTSGKGFNVGKIIDSALDTPKLCKDFGTGLISGTIDEIVDTGVQRAHLDHTGLNSDYAVKRGLSGFAVEGTKGAVSGVPERMFEGLVDVATGDKSLDEAVDGAFDVNEIAKDYVQNGADGAAKQVSGHEVTGNEISLKDLKDNNVRSKIPTDVISDPEKWIKNGGSIHMDSEGKVTFESRNMEKRNTPYTEPKDVIYYDDNGDVNYERSTVDSTQRQVGGHMTKSTNK